jgi:hypothetical protein
MNIRDLFPVGSIEMASQYCLKWKVHYLLTEEASIGRDRIHDPDSTFGREFSSVVFIAEYTRGEYIIADYQYPYAKQSNGGWMMTGRVVADWSKVEPISVEKVK